MKHHRVDSCIVGAPNIMGTNNEMSSFNYLWQLATRNIHSVTSLFFCAIKFCVGEEEGLKFVAHKLAVHKGTYRQGNKRYISILQDTSD